MGRLPPIREILFRISPFVSLRSHTCRSPGPCDGVAHCAREGNLPDHTQAATKTLPLERTLQVASAGRAGRSGRESARTGSARERSRPGERGAVWSGPGCVPGVGAVMTSAAGASGRGQIFTAPIRAGKLKTWKPDILPRHLPSRISVFQNFRFSPAPWAPRVWPGDRGAS